MRQAVPPPSSDAYIDYLRRRLSSTLPPERLHCADPRELGEAVAVEITIHPSHELDGQGSEELSLREAFQKLLSQPRPKDLEEAGFWKLKCLKLEKNCCIQKKSGLADIFKIYQRESSEFILTAINWLHSSRLSWIALGHLMQSMGVTMNQMNRMKVTWFVTEEAETGPEPTNLWALKNLCFGFECSGSETTGHFRLQASPQPDTKIGTLVMCFIQRARPHVSPKGTTQCQRCLPSKHFSEQLRMCSTTILRLLWHLVSVKNCHWKLEAEVKMDYVPFLRKCVGSPEADPLPENEYCLQTPA